MSWKLDENIATIAGNVAAGRSGNGPPLILAHGWPWSSFSWHRIIPKLSERFCVCWYDMPGYGQSEMRQDERTSLDVQGEVFAAILKHWSLDRPAVVAHDMGGAITLRAHLLHDCDFSALVLMNVVAMRPWGSEFFDHVGRHVDAFSGLPPHIHKAVVEAYIRGAINTTLDDDDERHLVSPWLSESGRISFYSQFAQADERFTAEIEPSYGCIRCPVGIIWGEMDPWIPLKRGLALHKRIPNASFEILKSIGHLPQLESPERVLSKLDRFLTAHL